VVSRYAEGCLEAGRQVVDREDAGDVLEPAGQLIDRDEDP
jgi:hypothetical protein